MSEHAPIWWILFVPGAFVEFGKRIGQKTTTRRRNGGLVKLRYWSPALPRPVPWEKLSCSALRVGVENVVASAQKTLGNRHRADPTRFRRLQETASRS